MIRTLWALALLPLSLFAQHENTIIKLDGPKEKGYHSKFVDPHHHRHPLRMAVLIGHGMLPEVTGDGILFVPSWGFDLDLHISDNWSLGWHNDLELENYLIIDSHGEQLELETPIVSSIDLFYRLNNNLIVGAGPGITMEDGEWKYLVRVGLEGEVPLNDRWEWTPTLFFDRRLDGHTVWTFAVGVAHYL